MARLDSLSIDLVTSGKDKLAEEYGKVIENLQHVTLSARLKNKDLSGDPHSGTLEAKRFANVSGKAYGTARGNGAGDLVKAKPVVVPLDKEVEYIEEVEEKDLQTYGVNGLIERRTKNHGNTLAVDLDLEFFEEAVSAGTVFTPEATDIEDIIEEAIQTIETTKNDFVNGVPRNMIKVIARPGIYGQLRNKINAMPNSNDLGKIANWEGGIFNNVEVFSNVFLPTGVDYIVMVDGAVAQPVHTVISNPQYIQLSKAVGFGLFTDRGVKAVMDDLIIYAGTPASD